MLTINAVAHAGGAIPSEDITVTTLYGQFMHIVIGSGEDRNIVLVRDKGQADALITAIKAVSAALDWDSNER